MDDESGFGVSHLTGLPMTVTFGAVLLFVLVLLLVLRLMFGNIQVSGGAGVR